MVCPVCKKPMLVLELQQIEIDYCQECEGIWLDAGELELLLDDITESNKLLASFNIDEGNSEKRHRCPVCSKKMHEVFVGGDKKILIDKCRKNHGLWFDKGELHEVVKLCNLDQNNRIVHLLNEMFAYKLKS